MLGENPLHQILRDWSGVAISVTYHLFWKALAERSREVSFSGVLTSAACHPVSIWVRSPVTGHHVVRLTPLCLRESTDLQVDIFLNAVCLFACFHWVSTPSNAQSILPAAFGVTLRGDKNGVLGSNPVSYVPSKCPIPCTLVPASGGWGECCFFLFVC